MHKITHLVDGGSVIKIYVFSTTKSPSQDASRTEKLTVLKVDSSQTPHSKAAALLSLFTENIASSDNIIVPKHFALFTIGPPEAGES